MAAERGWLDHPESVFRRRFGRNYELRLAPPAGREHYRPLGTVDGIPGPGRGASDLDDFTATPARMHHWLRLANGPRHFKLPAAKKNGLLRLTAPLRLTHRGHQASGWELRAEDRTGRRAIARGDTRKCSLSRLPELSVAPCVAAAAAPWRESHRHRGSAGCRPFGNCWAGRPVLSPGDDDRFTATVGRQSDFR